MTMVLDFAPEHWTSGMRLTALALADRVNQDWQAWPSLEDISKRTGLSTRQVRTHLKQLEAEGVIVAFVRRKPDGTRQPNLWTWLWKIHLQAEAGFTSHRKPASARS